MKIFEENLKPIRFSTKNNIIICERPQVVEGLQDMCDSIEKHVRDSQDEKRVEEGVLYGMKLPQSQKWYRAMLRHRKSTGVPVLQLMDIAGLYDFKPTTIIRKIHQNCDMKNVPFGEIKIFLHGVGLYEFNSECQYYFDELLLNVNIKTIFACIGEKTSQECFAGDFLYDVRGKLFSFRDVLIKEGVAMPSNMHRKINLDIYHRKMEILNQNCQIVPVACHLNDRYKYKHSDFIGEGTVRRLRPF